MAARLIAAACIAALAMLYASMLFDLAHAQERPSFDVALARVCVAEAGWDVDDTGECAAIYDVILRRAKVRDVSTVRALLDYSDAHFDEARPSRRPWVVGLTVRATEPRGWPRRLDWDRYRPRWLIVMQHAQKVIAGEVASPCVGRVDHWGGAMDDERARRAGLERVECGPAVRNHFWRIPRRDRGAS